MEQIDYNLLFRWFVGLGIDDPVWDHVTFSKNRDRLLEADVARKFLAAILAMAIFIRWPGANIMTAARPGLRRWDTMRAISRPVTANSPVQRNSRN